MIRMLIGVLPMLKKVQYADGKNVRQCVTHAFYEYTYVKYVRVRVSIIFVEEVFSQLTIVCV